MRKRRGRGLTKDKNLFEISHVLINEGIAMRDAREFLLSKRKKRFKLNLRGQAGFVFLIMTLLALTIFIFAAPILFEAINIGAASSGSVEGWIMKLFPWVILIALLATGYRLIFGGGG